MRRSGLAVSHRGSAMIEGTFVFLLLLGLLFLLMDLSWGIFAKASIQHAVREGVRYAVTSQTDGSNGQVASIKNVVQQNAMGFLAGSSNYALINVNFYAADTLAVLTGPGSNSGGNLVIVSVDNYQLKPMFPLLRPATPVQFSVRAGDKMEASPFGIPPQL